MTAKNMESISMERTLKSLVLIRAKHLAESVTTPMLLVAADGTLVFYNEAAEGLFGTPFTEVGQMPAADWGTKFNVRGRDHQPFPLEAMPGWIEMQGSDRPTTGHVRLTTLDGTDRWLAVCAFPLYTSQQQFEGGLVLLWQEDEE
jgi:PAS domain-containing protein